MVYSAAVTYGFIRDTEVNARISPTRIAIEQSSSDVYLVQVLKKERSVGVRRICGHNIRINRAKHTQGINWDNRTIIWE